MNFSNAWKNLKKYCPVLTITSSLLLWTYTAIAFGYEGEWRSWQDPQFTINLPADWDVVELSGLGERDLIAMPQPPDPQRLYSVDGQETIGMILVRVHQLDSDDLIYPLSILVEDEIKGWERFLTRYNLRFKLLEEFEYQANKYSGLGVVTLRSDMLDNSIFFLVGDYLFTVRIAYKSDLEEMFEGFFEKVMEGFTIQLQPQGEVTVETHSTVVGDIIMPSGWHLFEYESNPRVLITREEIVEGSTHYQAGVSIIRIDDLNVGQPDRVYQSWSYSYLGYYNPSLMRVLNTDFIIVDGKVSLYLEIAFWQEEKEEYYQVINVSSINGSSFYNITFEAPVKEFCSLRPFFMQALNSLKLK